MTNIKNKWLQDLRQININPNQNNNLINEFEKHIFETDNPAATMPSGDIFLPCKPCKGRGYDQKDDSLPCAACNGTGDGRYVWNPSDRENPSPTLVIQFTNKYKGTFGIWSNGRKIKQATGSELRYLKRVNFWVVSFTLLMVALCAAWGYWFITVGLYANAGIIK